MDERSKIPVSLPVSGPTESYWQATHDPGIRSYPQWTDEAHYVIVGSGISGACIAYNLLKKEPNATVVMLEARGACSGATGRNGGHTKGASYRHFPHEHESLGFDEAARIAKLEYANVKATHELVRNERIDCDINPSKTVDIIDDPEQLASAVSVTKYMNERVGGDCERYTLYTQEEARQRFLCPDALGAVEYNAGSVHSYKFATGVLRIALDKGLRIYTDAPVTSLEQRQDSTWTVRTGPRSVHAQQVILATNGYTAHLLPSVFQSLIVPLRGQITSQRPGSKMPKPLSHTYTFAYANGYEYMIPRPSGAAHTGDILIGGGWATLPGEVASEFAETDDSVLNPAVSKYLYDCTARYFGENWGEDDSHGRIRKEWTGIMGTSADGLPFVGKVPGKENLWASVSFNGHGMVMCLKCAEAVVTMMTGNGEEQKTLDSWFPRSFRLTPERIERLKKEKFQGRRNVKPPPQALEERSQL
ncbi:MAG: hypothetical protein Q9162_003658 [Coniocarpon cinnabarinum]